MKTAQEWIGDLDLEPHIEGGYFKQVLKSRDRWQTVNGMRATYTSIYFLLEEGNPSRFHRLTSDEIWYFHAGDSLTVHLLFPDGRYEAVELGIDVRHGQQLQYCVPKGTIFGSSVDTPGGYALVSCMVAPGFEYEDFELCQRQERLKAYPHHESIINQLTK